MSFALATRCAIQAAYAYLIAHHEHPESMCQYPRSEA